MASRIALAPATRKSVEGFLGPSAIHGAGVVRARLPAAILPRATHSEKGGSAHRRCLSRRGAVYRTAFDGSVRHSAQLHAMRRAMDVCEVAVFTVPMEKLTWMQAYYTQAIFIPVGANLVVAGEAAFRTSGAGDGKLSIAVFS